MPSLQEMLTRRTFILLFLCLSFIVPMTALGQADYRLEQLTVSFWPEFDQPQVLVIYQAVLPEEVALPALVELPMPVGVQSPHAVANATETGSLVNAAYEVVEADASQLVQVTAETRTVWVEYYQDLSFNGERRSFSYQWPGSMAADSFDYEVQQPAGAQSLQLDPSAGGQRIGSDGLTYLTGSFGAVGQGDTRTLEFTYQKNTDDLTAAEQTTAPLEGVSIDPPAASEPASTVPSWLIGALIGLGLALAVAFGYWLWRRRAPAQPRRRRRRSRTQPEKPAANRYCHQCGQQVGLEDRFCSHCGAEQRS